MACTRERGRLLADLVNGQLDGERVVELLDHVEGCPECSREFDLASKLVAAGEAGAFPPRTSAWQPRRSWTTAAAAAAAVLLMIAIFGGGTGDEAGAKAWTIAPLSTASSTLRGSVPDRGEAWEEALERYAAGDFEGAADALSSLDGARSDPLASLYLGSSLLMSDRPGDALAALALAASQGTGMVREHGAWYAALAELELGETQRARARLGRLVEEAGPYAPNARALLDELDGGP